jgi:hypothetical protein
MRPYAAICGQGAQAVAEPQGGTAQMCPQFNDHLTAGEPQQVFEHAQVLGELLDAQPRVDVAQVLAFAFLPVRQKPSFGHGSHVRGKLCVGFAVHAASSLGHRDLSLSVQGMPIGFGTDAG